MMRYILVEDQVDRCFKTSFLFLNKGMNIRDAIFILIRISLDGWFRNTYDNIY